MSKASYWQRGEAIDYTNNTDETIEANEIVVLGSRIGVAGTEIPAGQVGSLHVFGVFEMPKKDTTAINAGTTVYWNPDEDAPGITVSADDGGSPAVAFPSAGYAIETADANAETVRVKLLG